MTDFIFYFYGYMSGALGKNGKDMDLNHRETRDSSELRFVFVQRTNLECIIVWLFCQGLPSASFFVLFGGVVFFLFFSFSIFLPIYGISATDRGYRQLLINNGRYW